MFDYQNIDLISLETHFVKKNPCVYFLLRNEEVVYVGQSINFPARLTSHLSSSKEFDSYKLLPIPEELDLNEVEYHFINKLQPEYNIHGIEGKVGPNRFIKKDLTENTGIIYLNEDGNPLTGAINIQGQPTFLNTGVNKNTISFRDITRNIKGAIGQNKQKTFWFGSLNANGVKYKLTNIQKTPNLFITFSLI